MHFRVDEEVTFRKLEILLAYMETGNLARAAETLGVSTVSVHRALHSLEEGLRCPLFRHEGRNLLPTEAARVLSRTRSITPSLLCSFPTWSPGRSCDPAISCRSSGGPKSSTGIGFTSACACS